MNYEKFQPLLGEWAEFFKPFIESKEMDDIYSFLRYKFKQGAVICPDSRDVFRTFEETPKNISVVIYAMDPYPTIKDGIKVANGVPMDCRNTGILQPSLDKFYEGIEKELFRGLKLNGWKSPDLRYLPAQGVMLVNSDLTVEAYKSGSHKGVWIKFQKYFIEEILNKYYKGLIFVLMGKNSLEVQEFIDENVHYVYTCEHPVAASYAGRL